MATPVQEATVIEPAGDPDQGPAGDSDQAGAGARWLWQAPLTVLLAFVLPIVVLMQAPTPPIRLLLVLQLALCAYTGARLCAVVSAPRISPLEGMFWLFCYTAMGIAPLAQVVVGRSPVPMPGPVEDQVHGVLLVVVGCLAFDVGTTLNSETSRRSARSAYRVRARRLVDIPHGRVAVFVALALAGTALLVATLGVAALFASREAIGNGFDAAGLSGDSQAGRATLRGIGTVPVLLAFLLLTRRLVTDRMARGRPLLVAAWAVTLLAQVLVNNPISSARFWFVTVALSTALVLFPRRLGVFRALLLSGVVLSLVVFPVADRFRYDDGEGRVQRTSTVGTLATKDYDQMNMMVNTVTYVQDGPGHTWGRQTAGHLLFWLPRSVWDSKPRDTGTIVGEYFGTANVNLSEPLWAELWIDFGLPGMLLGFLALGYVFRRGDRWYAWAVDRGRHISTIGMIAVPVLAGYSAILLRGSLLQAMGRLGVMVGCFVLLAAWTRRRGEPENPDPASPVVEQTPSRALG
jgi:hypothetical protein